MTKPKRKTITDKYRLDWLEENHIDIYEAYGRWIVGGQEERQPTLRQAIDAAIRAEGDGK